MLDAVPYIIQIALFGAAGTCFVRVHLQNRAADRSDDQSLSAAERFRFLRIHKRPAHTPGSARLRRASLVQSLWGFVFLVGAFASPYVFRLLGFGSNP